MPLIVLPIIAFLSSMALHRLALLLFPRLGLLDFPERYGLVRPRIPYPAGIIAVLLFLAFFFDIVPWNMQNAGVGAGAILLTAFCVLDDLRPLPVSARLPVQIGVSLLIFASGSRIYSLTSPLPSWTGSDILSLDAVVLSAPFFGPLPFLSGIFTILWLGLTTNALNWFDGIPGQVSVIATIGFLTIGALALSARVDQPSLALLSFLLAAICAGGMFLELPPPRMLLGDTGAMFYGLLLGVLTIYAGGKVATAFLVLGVPLVDFIIVAARRVLRGQSPFSHTKEHLHDLLLARGWRPGHIILLTASIGTAFGASALFLSTFGKFVAGLLLFFLMVGLSTWAKNSRTITSPHISSAR